MALGWVAFICADLAFGSVAFISELFIGVDDVALLSFNPGWAWVDPVIGLATVDLGSDTVDFESLVPGVVWAAAATAMPAAKTKASGTVGENFIGVLRW